MKNYILDSCVWVSFCNPEDTQHEKAKMIVEHMKGCPIFVLECIVAEVTGVLQKRSSKIAVEKFLTIVEETEGISFFSCSEKEILNAFEIFKAQKSSALSFVDTILASLSKKYEVITFDEALQKALLDF